MAVAQTTAKCCDGDCWKCARIDAVGDQGGAAGATRFGIVTTFQCPPRVLLPADTRLPLRPGSDHQARTRRRHPRSSTRAHSMLPLQRRRGYATDRLRGDTVSSNARLAETAATGAVTACTAGNAMRSSMMPAVVLHIARGARRRRYRAMAEVVRRTDAEAAIECSRSDHAMRSAVNGTSNWLASIP